MIAIKKHYIGKSTSEDTFVKEFLSFVLNPTEDKAKMPGAIRRFNLMPKILYKESDLEKLAKYLYKNEIEKPEWFEAHYLKENQSDNMQNKSDSGYIEKGKKITSMAQQELSKNLLNALNTGGTDFALSFCNSKALFLTDSISNSLNFKLKRVSDNIRNHLNVAEPNEIAYIKILKENIKNGLPLTPKIISGNGEKKGLYPIVTNSVCTQCHGNEKDINPEVLNKIKKLYPGDKAIGYKENEIRGLWVVKFL
jgi:glutamyl/glutaminyl-tRNA synthetase